MDNELKYAQQHLANERTYLAWMRTGISVVGVGFLSVTLHFNFGKRVSETTDLISIAMMILSLMIGIFILLLGTFSYISKRKHINENTFRSSQTMIAIISLAVSILMLLLGTYFITVIY